MKKQYKCLLISFIIAAIISITNVIAQGPPPQCGGQYEPASDPSCGSGYPTGECTLGNPCTGTLGHKTKYCCQEYSTTRCVTVEGKWKCCDGQWVLRCKKITDVIGSACIQDHNGIYTCG